MTSADRYAPEIPFPPYAYVPGRHPHPGTNPDGHRFGKPREIVPPPSEATLKSNPHFQLGVDLFNHGYYWEAHEIWEELWVASGRAGQLADFFKGLIKLAAAGVKAREGNLKGVIKHASRARELFLQTNQQALASTAGELELRPVADSTVTIEGNPVLAIRLRLEDFELE